MNDEKFISSTEIPAVVDETEREGEKIEIETEGGK